MVSVCVRGRRRKPGVCTYVNIEPTPVQENGGLRWVPAYSSPHW
jgi:hypothetical protein